MWKKESTEERHEDIYARVLKDRRMEDIRTVDGFDGGIFPSSPSPSCYRHGGIPLHI